jgi:hypothetical protein
MLPAESYLLGGESYLLGNSGDEDAHEDREDGWSSDTGENEAEEQNDSSSDAGDGSTSEDLLNDHTAKKAKKGAKALATQTPKRLPQITVFVSTKSGMTGRTQCKLRDEELGYDTKWAVMKAAVLAKGQGMVEKYSLESCSIYAVARNQNGEASFREAPSLLTCAADWGDMVKVATKSKGGKKRRTDAKDKGDLFFLIQVSPEAQKVGKGAAKAGPAAKKRRRGSGDSSLDTNDTSDEGDAPCPVAVHELRLRLPICREGATLATCDWKGDLKTKVVANKKLDPPLLLYGDSGELAKTIEICDAMITRLGENADTKASHYNVQATDDVSTALFMCSKPRAADDGIYEVASSAVFGNLVPDRKKGTGRTRKTQVDIDFMMISKPSTTAHPYMEQEAESGTWDGVVASASQGSPARAVENRPPVLMGAIARTARKNQGIVDSAKGGQLMSALKGMCNRGQTLGALDLTVTHRRAIVDRILAGDLDEVSQTDGWTESYVRELPWQACDIDESKRHATTDIFQKLIASVCKYSEAMRSDVSQRMPKPFIKTAEEPNAMARIATVFDNGLKIIHTTGAGGGGEPQGHASAAAAASETATNDHLEALQKRQDILEKQVEKLQAKYDNSAADAASCANLKAKIDKLQDKIDELDDKICDLV